MWSVNKGKFLQLIEILSNYGPVLIEHLIKLEQSTQSHSCKILTSYMSPTTKSEFILLFGGIVKEKILTDIKYPKYFSIIFDRTQDISHIDKMRESIRCIQIEKQKVEITESFIGFFQLTGRKAIGITEDILKVIERDGLDITICRGQGYGNASTMAGVHS
ncbi:hypothetical protein AVEN_121097-1 [Araneus ventricosus]|uniref:Uncharacterized protein n=1 Tax=Araneus ventricosus TaxID=182803 RepID=A0A4Y2M2V6_ARAVE|nr:hypothetical protein AVEN_121097-1 [Araneus ventricosus]